MNRFTITSAAVATTRKPATLDHTAVVSTIRVRPRGPFPAWRNIRGAHISGKFDAPVADVVAYNTAVAAQYRLHYFTTTESEQVGILAALRKALGPTWQVAKVGEYVCAARGPLVLDDTQVSLHQFTHTPGLPTWRDLKVGAFPARIRWLRIPVTITAGHTPSSVEMGDAWRDHPALVRTWLAGVEAWAMWLEKRRGLLIANGDFNIDQHRPVWRRTLAAHLRGQTSVYDAELPAAGSHGSRLIDGMTVGWSK